MSNLRKFFMFLGALIVYAASQLASDNAVGSIDWFFKNLPPEQLPSDYAVLNILGNPYMDFFFSWLPVVCLAFSVLLFMDRKALLGYLLIAFPLIPAAIMTIMFYNAAQIHVPPGETLYGSGVLLPDDSPIKAKLKAKDAD